MFIGELATESGFSKDTIRYYEKVGLIQSDGYVRQANNYKNYSSKTLERLRHVKELKGAGFTLLEIIDLLQSFQKVDDPCSGLQKKLADKVEKLNDKIKSLESYKNTIQNIANACNSSCAVENGLPCCMRGV